MQIDQRLQRAVKFVTIGTIQSSNAILLLLLSPFLLRNMGEVNFNHLLIIFSFIGCGTIVSTAIGQGFPIFKDEFSSLEKSPSIKMLHASAALSLIFCLILCLLIISSNAWGGTNNNWLNDSKITAVILIIILLELIDYTLGQYFKYSGKLKSDLITDFMGRSLLFIALIFSVTNQSSAFLVLKIFAAIALTRVFIRGLVYFSAMKIKIRGSLKFFSSTFMEIVKLIPFGIIAFSTGTLDRISIGITAQDETISVAYILGSQFGSVSLLIGSTYLTMSYIRKDTSLLFNRAVLVIIGAITLFSGVLAGIWAYISFPLSYFNTIIFTVFIISISNFILISSGYLKACCREAKKSNYNNLLSVLAALLSIPAMMYMSSNHGVTGALYTKLSISIVLMIVILRESKPMFLK